MNRGRVFLEEGKQMQRSGGSKIQLRNRKGEGALMDMVGVSPLS